MIYMFKVLRFILFISALCMVHLVHVLFPLIIACTFNNIQAIETTGLRRNDPRLEPCRRKFEEKKQTSKSEGDFKVNRAEFSE